MKKVLPFIILCLAAFTMQAQTNQSWSRLQGQSPKPAKTTQRMAFPKEFILFQFTPETFRQTLAAAPERFGSKKAGVVISLPAVDGTMENYEVFEASNFDPALQAQFPEIRSYVGRGITDKRALLRMSVDPHGIQTMVFRTDKRNEFMEPYSEDGSVYAVFNSSREKGSLPFTCSTEDVAIANNLAADSGATHRTTSADLLTFRLALSCNGEYATYFGGTVAGALAAMNATLTRVNGVFEMDFAIHMNLIANNTTVIYTNSLTDPYTSMGQWNGQLQNTLTANIGEANYDIGHMFGATGGGGNAGCIGCVCVDGQKGRGITSPADGIPMGDNFDIDYVAHEMGHQFGGNHTFSNSVEGTGVNVEPGSGSTIMGYAGITAQDIQAHSDDYFVYANIKQVQDNMVGKTCPTHTPLDNIAPVMNAGTDYTIPKSTPFRLEGSGSDGNGDALTYCWEQNDTATTQTGTNSQASATKTGGPNWRSYDPVSVPVRWCPPLARVKDNFLTSIFMDGATQIRTEAVSSVARTLNFTLTGRDHVLGVGLTGTDAMVVTVNATAGPFLVSSPNTNVSWEAGSNQTVTWDVAGTTANNVNAAFVDIFLSTDGGLTYPVMLASQVPNDGSETVSIPNMTGTTNRIMVKGYNHIFYDISNTDFSIAAPASTFEIAFSGVAGEQYKSSCQGQDISYTIPYTALGGFAGETTFSASGVPAGASVNFSPASMTSDGNVTISISGTNSAAPGLYPITITGTSGAIVKTVPLYLQLYSSGFAAVSGQSPANGAITQNTSLTLSWAADANATSYEVLVSLDPAMTAPIFSGTVSGTTYAITGLSEGTTYYWSVRPANASCSGEFSTPASFQTGQIACDTMASANVPMTISATGAPTINSTLVIADGVTISDVNITMNVSHTWINDLTATLISPSGTQVQLFAAPCSSDAINNIIATFDDSGVPVVCGNNPGIGGTVQPIQPLSAFVGQNSAGTWTLRIADAYNQDGGALNSWSLNICNVQPLATAQHQWSNFAIYPNPNHGNFNISFSSETGNKVQISVHDIRGREIFSKSYINSGLFNENLQLDRVETGLYLVTVQSGDVKEVRKIVVE
ncbi:MAG: T9SS type A sorting domain-containing protein [Flavobacterium sp.]|nr:MAG: T9SS type A sorting domain-containing protein [Flavobacterium sp.]